jgi:hypothetical protein
MKGLILAVSISIPLSSQQRMVFRPVRPPHSQPIGKNFKKSNGLISWIHLVAARISGAVAARVRSHPQRFPAGPRAHKLRRPDLGRSSRTLGLLPSFSIAVGGSGGFETRRRGDRRESAWVNSLRPQRLWVSIASTPHHGASLKLLTIRFKPSTNSTSWKLIS